MVARNYSGFQKYVPIEFVNLSKVIASEAKQSLRFCKRLLRRKAPRNDSLSEYIFDSYYKNLNKVAITFLGCARCPLARLPV